MSRVPYLIVSVHDVTPATWDQVKSILDRLSSVGVKRRSLLVIPNWKGQSPIHENLKFSDWLRERQDQGDEIVLHGYEHVGVGEPKSVWDRIRNRLFTLNEGEFLALDYAEARRRIEAGMRIFKSAVLESAGFIAPAWLINREGLAAARDMGFQYTNSYLEFSDLSSRQSVLAPSLVFGPGTLNEDLGIAMQRLASKILTRMPLVRVVIHPPCIDNARRFDRILRMIDQQLAHHQPVTYLELLCALRATAAGTKQGQVAGKMTL